MQSDRRIRWIAAVFLALIAGCESHPPKMVNRASSVPQLDQHPTDTDQPEDWFHDVTDQSGVRFKPQTGREAGRFTLLETLGGGVAAVDVDRDGDTDLLLAGGGEIDSMSGIPTGTAPALFLNDGTGRFTNASHRLASESWPYSHGWAVGDYDRDGDDDFALMGFERTAFLRNEDGERIVDVTSSAGVQTETWDTSGVFLDANHDGWLDLYIASYVDFDPQTSRPCPRGAPPQPDVCPPQRFAPQRDHLWINNGDGTFAEAAEVAGLLPTGRGLGVLAADFNGDGLADLYVANDGDPNHLYLGRLEFPWVEAGVASGVATNEAGAAEGSMGLAWDDFDGDGHSDLFVTNFELEDNSLYRGLGEGLFQHATVASGMSGQGRLDVRFGSGSIDFDHDGWPDLFALSGHVVYHSLRSPFLQRPSLYRNEAGKRFRNVSERGGSYFRSVHCGRGCAVIDLNNDGGQDLVLVDLLDSVQVLQSTRSPAHWIRISLSPKAGDPMGIGARVAIPTGHRTVLWSPQRGAGFASHSPCEWHGTLLTSDAVEVTVTWPSRRTERFGPLAADRRHHLREGTGHAAAPISSR